MEGLLWFSGGIAVICLLLILDWKTIFGSKKSQPKVVKSRPVNASNQFMDLKHELDARDREATRIKQLREEELRNLQEERRVEELRREAVLKPHKELFTRVALELEAAVGFSTGILLDCEEMNMKVTGYRIRLGREVYHWGVDSYTTYEVSDIATTEPTEKALVSALKEYFMRSTI